MEIVFFNPIVFAENKLVVVVPNAKSFLSHMYLWRSGFMNILSRECSQFSKPRNYVRRSTIFQLAEHLSLLACSVHFSIYMYLYLYSYRRETARQLRMYAQLTRCFSAVAELLVYIRCHFVSFSFATDTRNTTGIQYISAFHSVIHWNHCNFLIDPYVYTI